ncbi:MAG TPA: hypothetical protein VGK72_01925 [Chthoniobacterales bacterium]
MDLPQPPHRPRATRAPTNGLKLMLAALIIFALLAGYGQWEHFRRSEVITGTVRLTPNE